MDRILFPRSFRQSIAHTPLAPRLDSLENKTIYMLCPRQTGSFIEHVFAAFEHWACGRFPGVRCVLRFKSTEYFSDEPALWDEVIANADAFLFGGAPSSSTTHWCTRWACELEKRGCPGSMTIYESLFNPADSTRKACGVPVRIATFEYPPDQMDAGRLNAGLRQVEENLIQPLFEEELRDDFERLPPPPKFICTTSSLADDYFYAQGWTDGLPIVAPTESAVAEMLTGTSHAPDELVSQSVWPESLPATVEQVAINGVMAGCTKEHLPVLLAAVEAFGKGDFHSEVRSTNAFAYIQVINGSITQALDMNSGIYALGPGNRSNARIGRALRLFFINLGGAQPGLNVMSTQGNPTAYGFCIPEHPESPFLPLSSALGHSSKENCLTILGGCWAHVGNYLTGDLTQLAKDIRVFEWPFGVLLILSLKAAQLFSARGMSRDDIRDYVWTTATVTAGDFRNRLYYNWFVEPVLRRARETGAESPWPTDYLTLSDDAQVSLFPRQNIHIVVAGGDANPMMQAWMVTGHACVSIDHWM